MKYVAEANKVEAGKGSGPAGRGGATLGDLLKDKLSGITPKVLVTQRLSSPARRGQGPVASAGPRYRVSNESP